MSLNTTPEIIDDIRAGKMVILMDDEDRENEGDLVIAAEHITPEAINFMAKYGRGLVCLTITQARNDQLKLWPQSRRNNSPYHTAFTVSIEAAEGVTTGISAGFRQCFKITCRSGSPLARAVRTWLACSTSIIEPRIIREI